MGHSTDSIPSVSSSSEEKWLMNSKFVQTDGVGKAGDDNSVDDLLGTRMEALGRSFPAWSYKTT